MKTGESSLPEIICRPLFFIKRVKAHYTNDDGITDYHSHDLFSHVLTGLIVCLFFSFLGFFSKWFLIGVFVAWLLHVIVKEVILDKKKRLTPHDQNVFIVDLITRNYGFLIGLPFVVINFFK